MSKTAAWIHGLLMTAIFLAISAACAYLIAVRRNEEFSVPLWTMLSLAAFMQRTIEKEERTTP